MNIIHSKPQNRLHHERVDKLEFISINTRTRASVEAGEEVRAEARAEVDIEEERAEQEDRLLLHYEMKKQ